MPGKSIKPIGTTENKREFPKGRAVYWAKEYLSRVFLDFLFPVECLGCGQESVWICDSCFGSIPLSTRQYCQQCKRETEFGEFCPRCRQGHWLDGISAACDYGERLVAKSIKAFKFNFIKELAPSLDKLLYLSYQQLEIKYINQARTGNVHKKKDRITSRYFSGGQDFLIVPVPLSARRLRFRGFNQSELLAKLFAGYLEMEITPDFLARSGHNVPQSKLSEKDRYENIKGCFCANYALPENCHVLLIDDIVTTCATLDECAKTAKNAGAQSVWALALAKG